MSFASLLQYVKAQATDEDLKQIKSALRERSKVLVCEQDMALIRERIEQNGYCVLGRSYEVGGAAEDGNDEAEDLGDSGDEAAQKPVPGCEDLCKRLLYCPVRVSANDHIRARDVTIDSDQDDSEDENDKPARSRHFHKHLHLDFSVHDKGLVMEKVDNDAWDENDADDPMHAETTVEVYLYTHKKHAGTPKQGWTDGSRIRIVNCDGDLEDWMAIQGHWYDIVDQAKVRAAIAKDGGNADNNKICKDCFHMSITDDLDDNECTLVQVLERAKGRKSNRGQ
jgi:hypothetical protein